MQILHYCARIRLQDGGVVSSVIDLAQSLSHVGASVTLMATQGDDWPIGGIVQTMQTGSFDRPPIRFSSKRLAVIRPHIEQSDVLHLHTPWEPANLQLARIARQCHTPYIVSIHGMLDRWVMKKSNFKKRLFLRLGGRNMLHNAAAVHCTCMAEADQVKRWIPKANIATIPLVFDPSEYLDPPSTSDPDKHWPPRASERPVILFLSRLHPKKGVDRLIRAAAIVTATHDARFIIAGCGSAAYEQELRLLVEELRLHSHVDFAGFVEGDRKISLYRATDVFVLPASQEHFYLALPEAMACRVPVVTTRGVDIWSELQESGGALIIDDDPASIAKAILQLLADPTRLTEMGLAGQRWVTQTFSGNAVTSKYMKLYREAINR